jgi:hypothetical protein
LPLCCYLGVVHFMIILTATAGTLDCQTMLIFINGAMMTVGAQYIHFWRDGRRKSHRWAFIINTSFCVTEFFLSWIGSQWIERKLNYCPALVEAMTESTTYPWKYTFCLILANVVLCGFDQGVWMQDKEKNKGDPNPRIHTRPKWLLWVEKKWTPIRIFHCMVGFILCIGTIVMTELLVIRKFFKYINSVDGLAYTSIETLNPFNAPGQPITLVMAVLAFFSALRQNLAGKLKPSKATGKCTHICYNPRYVSSDRSAGISLDQILRALLRWTTSKERIAEPSATIWFGGNTWPHASIFREK